MSNVVINLKKNPESNYYTGRKVLDSNTYNFAIWYNEQTLKWYMNIEGVTNDLDRKSVALLCGKDLSKPWGQYDFGELWVIDNSGADEDPDRVEMGSRWTLEYIPLADL